MSRIFSPLLVPTLLAASLVGGGALMGGCKSGSGPSVLKSAGSSAGSSTATAGNSAEGTNAPGPRDPARPADLLSIDALPAELKNDAFEYYGLGRKLPISMTITTSAGPQVGAQDVRLLKMTPEEAQFEITSTDGLSLFGRNVVSLRKDGIRILESEIMHARPTDYELPAGLAPGKSWSAVQSVEDGSRSMKVTLVQKVVGPQNVTTKVGSYPDALYVTGEGNGIFNGKPIRMQTQSWFVKGRGNVKNVIASTQNGKTDTTTIEESK